MNCPMKPAPSLVTPLPVTACEPENLKAVPANERRAAESKKQNQVLPAVVTPKPTASFYETAYYWLMSR